MPCTYVYCDPYRKPLACYLQFGGVVIVTFHMCTIKGHIHFDKWFQPISLLCCVHKISPYHTHACTQTQTLFILIFIFLHSCLLYKDTGQDPKNLSTQHASPSSLSSYYQFGTAANSLDHTFMDAHTACTHADRHTHTQHITLTPVQLKLYTHSTSTHVDTNIIKLNVL